MKTAIWAMVLVLIASIIGSLGAVYLKKASKSLTLDIKSIFNKKLIFSLFLYGISTILFIPALKGGELSILFPLVATVYIWVALLSTKLLHEKMNKHKWIGISLIISGVIFIGLAR